MQEQPTLSVEMVIRGQYVIENLLGRSGSGATYLVRDQRARDATSNRFVLKEVVEPNKQARHQLVSAGKFLRQLHHPGLTPVRRVLDEHKYKRVFWLMDYIAGQDLETLRHQQTEHLFSWTDVMYIMAPIIAAVTYLHQQQPPIIHGDIKPANIIVLKEGSGVILVDFGMIKAFDPRSSRAADRYCYRAPEQSNRSIDVRTDIYALGATFYMLATGKLPPDAYSRLTQVSNEALDPLEPVNSLMPALPMHIGKTIERAMALDAQHRFSSVEQFWEALWLVLADHPAPVFGIPSVPKGSPAVTTPGPEQEVGQTIDKPVSEPPSVELVSESIKERRDLDIEKLSGVTVMDNVEGPEDLDAENLPVVPMLDSVEEREDLEIEKPQLVVPVPESVEEPEDPDATVRLPKQPPVVRIPLRTEEPKDLDSEKTLPKLPPVLPAGVEEQKDLYVVKLLPKPPGDVRAPISLRKLGMLVIGLALLLSLGIGAIFFSRARIHPATYSATRASHSVPPVSRSTSAPVASSHSTLAAWYKGTIYDISANVATTMSLTGIQQTQVTIGGNFTGLHRTGTFNGIIDPHPPKHLQFTVKDPAGHVILSFDGHLQSDGELSGSYCSVDQDAHCTGDYGLWSVAPAS
jgi:serine/threonine protein kinase